MLTGCMAGNGVISPIIPDGNYESDRGHEYPDDSNHRTISESPSNASMIMTGPEEYLTSELSVKLITSARPIFSAKLTNIDGIITSDNFHARIDRDQISCIYNSGDSTVTFQPDEDLKDGMYQASLFFVNPSGSTRMLHWSFRIRTALPSINMVMWNLESKWALVIFDDAIEPSVMKDPSRWSFNRERNILRGPIGSAGDNMALLPLTNQAIGLYHLREALTIGFTDKNGIIEYIVSRGGGSVREAQVSCENCSGIGYEWFIPEHTELEAGVEKYAAAYTYKNPLPCPLEMVWEGWTRIPVAHYDPTGDFYQEQDTMCEGQPDVGHPGEEYPEYFSMLINPNETNTIAFDRLYKHDVTVSVWADCNGLNRPGIPPSEYETQIEWKRFQFGDSNSSTQQGFDCVNPVFDVEPVVLYGDEAADMIEDLMAGIPMKGEDVSGDQYCYSIPRDPEHAEPNEITLEDLLSSLRNNSCDLFILAKANDPIGSNRHGFMDIQHMVLDMRHETGQCDWGDVTYGMVTGAIGIDHYPWGVQGDLYPGASLDDSELIPWPDPDYPQSTGGNFYTDGIGEESAIMYWNLTDLLLEIPGNEDVNDIRVRIVDGNISPESGVDGNWRRSDNVMDQVCDLVGTPERRGADVSYICDSIAHVECIAKNPYETIPPGEEREWKNVGFSYECNTLDTNFIIPRISCGTSVITIATYLENKDARKNNPCKDPNELKVDVRSLELGITAHPLTDFVVLKKYENATCPKPTLDRMGQIFQIPFWRALCKCQFYIGTFIVTDDIKSTDDVVGDSMLYVSSWDHALPDNPEDKRDISITFSRNLADIIQYEGNLPYGQLRGVGAETPNLSKYQWYGYDDYIKRGGFEVVEINKCFTGDGLGKYYLENNDEYKYIPVQSEADVMIIQSHGTKYCPMFAKFGYPLHHLGTGFNAETFVIGGINDEEGHPSDKGYKLTLSFLPNDFIPPDHIFWLQDLHEQPSFNPLYEFERLDMGVKWVLGLSCYSLVEGSGRYANTMWKTEISEGYLLSICGFQEFLGYTRKVAGEDAGEVFDTGCVFLGKYCEKLKLLDQTSGYCYLDSGKYTGSDPFSKDPSIAAFMETSLELLGDEYYNYWGKQGVNDAAGIAHDERGFSKWYIKAFKQNVNQGVTNPSDIKAKDENYEYKIIRKGI